MQNKTCHFILCCLAANVSPRKPIFSMDTNFQNSKNWTFSNLDNFFTAKLYINDKYSVQINHVWFTNAMNKKTQMFIIFVSLATELTDRQKFYKILHFQSKLSCLCKQTYGLCKHFLPSLHLFSKNEKLKIMKLFKYRLPWQPNHQIVSYFIKKSIFKAKHLP